MLERLALTALTAGLAGYWLARHQLRNEGERHFNELMDSLPWFEVEAIEDYLSGEQPIIVTWVED